MKAVMKTHPAPGCLALADMPDPAPREGHLLVRVRAAALCGTDLHIYHWNDWAAANYSPPCVMGHELCGEVIWVPPGETDFREGDLVSVETHIACGRCYQCQRGEGHVCQNLRLYSKSGYGAMGEMALVPIGSARRVPQSASFEVGAVLEPLGVAVHALEATQVAGAFVGVMGCGPIGLFAIAVARSLGARGVLAVEPAPYRRQLAAVLGANLVIDPLENSASEVMLEQTGGRGVDVVVEASGRAEGLIQGLLGLRRGGAVALIGVPSKPISLDLAALVITRGVTLYGSFGRRIDRTWHTMEGLLASGVLDASKVITHRLPLSGYQEAFETAGSGLSGKVLLVP